jgi:hypothetical protein
MIHYHGLPITPVTVAHQAISGGHAFISYVHPEQVNLAVEVCQSFALDNGAFSLWKSGESVSDWSGFYDWALNLKRIPSCDFAVIPDVIDGGENENDALLKDCPFPKWFGSPVWHFHESLDRLDRLAHEYVRVCLGSSGKFSTVGSAEWFSRMGEVMRIVCDADGFPVCKLHGLRMLNPSIFTKFPFSSVDSTNIARNVGIDKNWKSGNYPPVTKEARSQIMRQRIESFNAPSAWNFQQLEQFDLF